MTDRGSQDEEPARFPRLARAVSCLLPPSPRALAALLGGYALASAFTAFFSLALPLPPAEAVLTASLLGFVVYVAAIILVFATRSAMRAWGWMLGPSLLLVAGTYLLWSAR